MTYLRHIARTALLVAACLPFVACVHEVQEEEEIGADESTVVESDPDCSLGAERACLVIGATQQQGLQSCIEDDIDHGWNACEAIICPEGTFDNGQCCVDDVTGCCEDGSGCSGSTMSTPLVLSFDGAAVSYHQHMSGAFDLTGQGQSYASDWPTAATPWLALDRNGDGMINGGHELFGSATPLAGGATATHGFEALAALDSNRDGQISAADPGFAQLLVWRDDGDRISQPAELMNAADAGLTFVELSYDVSRRCDERGNCEIERARFGYRHNGQSAIGEIVDVHLAHR